MLTLKDLAYPNYFLGMEVNSVHNGIHLFETKYVKDLLQNFEMEEANSLVTPLMSVCKLSTT